MTTKYWKVIAVEPHDSGRVTLTLQDEHGTTKTEDYPADAVLNVVARD